MKLFANRDELWLARIFSLIIGLVAIILAIYFSDILNLILFIYSFYVPIVSVPIFFAIIGLELPTRNITAGIIFGVVIVLFWSKIQTFFNIDKSIDAFIPGILANITGVYASIKFDRLKNRK